MVHTSAVLGLALLGLMAVGPVHSYDFWDDLYARYPAAESVNKFSFKFIEQVFKYKSGNAVFSTFDPYVLLSLVYNGVQGDAKKQLYDYLEYSGYEHFEKFGFKSLVEKYYALKKYEYKAESKFFYSNAYSFKPTFLDVVQKYYKTAPVSVDFKKHDETVKAINDWADKVTDSHFKNYISSDKFDDATFTFLASALYFKGKFANKFESFSTTAKPFYFEDGTTKDVPTLKTYGSFGAGYLFPGQYAKFIEFPLEYKNLSESFYMYVIIPEDYTNLAYVESRLKDIDFASLKAKDEAYFNLYIPKFKFESSYDFEKIFPEFGISKIFYDGADFSEMTDKPYKINKFYQKAAIEIDEYTNKNAPEYPKDGNQAKDFYVNKPFLAFIKSNDVIVAAARIYDPTKDY